MHSNGITTGSTQETRLIPYWLHLGERFSIGKRNIGTVSIAGLLNPDNGHCLVVQESDSRTLTQLDTLTLGDLPMELLKHEINSCRKEHRRRCFVADPDRLRNLRVIDCAQIKIVNASVGCEYVALPYVWGSREVEEKHTSAFWLDDVPKTIPGNCFVAQSLGYNYLWVDRFVSRKI